MTHDEIEFLISQHFDGTLDAAEAQKLRAVLDSDASARSLFEQHDRLDRALKASRKDLGIDPEWLTAEIAGHIDEASSQSFRIGRWLAPLAAAATVLVGLSVGIALWNRETASPPAIGPVANSVVLNVPTARPQAVANVSVGIPSNMTPAMMSALFLAEQRHSGRVVIQPAGQPRHEPPFE